jgi:aryl-alcohol dehydrogenase-like predicted oxidoreductase
MKYKILGKTGVRVSEVCLGAMTFGDEWGPFGANKEESKKVFDAFVEAGGNFVDTANLYTSGTSERYLGEFMGTEREKIVLATKYTNSMPTGDPNSAGNHRKNLVQSLDASLKRLKTDYIDLYWVHCWDFMSSVESVMRALDDAVRSGKVLYVGISDAPAWIVSRANTMAELRGWSPFVALQVEYSLAERTVERELLPMADALDLTVTPWGPLKGGTLTGKYLDKKADSNARYNTELAMGFYSESERVNEIAREVIRIAKDLGKTPAQVALAWLKTRGSNILPIIGAKSVAQLRDNLGYLDVNLSESQINSLNSVSSIEMGFPFDFMTSPMAKNVMYAGMREAIEV